ncbi:MAG: dienelactone hydrolase family protein [Anaerolineae bacterium]|nr:dienelactone hydrolase family protein [Anaerolineae bacterium]
MTAYDSNRAEYGITNGHIQIVMEGGRQLPAYWAHPNSGRLFPAVALIHDWWGITPAVRRIAHRFAQVGYYVIVPDLFDGQVASTPERAIELVKALGDTGYPRVDAALSVLETHNNTNHDVAVVGIGMGGSLAYEAAIIRKDMEAAVVYYGFPQRYFGRLKELRVPLLAIYGEQEQYVTVTDINRTRRELDSNPHKLEHEVLMLPNVGHDFFADSADEAGRVQSQAALNTTFSFLEKYLKGPSFTGPLKRI